LEVTQVSLADYTAVFRKRWWVFAIVALLTTVLALAWSLLQTPLYYSEARILVNSRSSAEIFDPVATSQNSGALSRQLANERQFFESDRVRRTADEQLRAAGVAVAPGDIDGDNVLVGSEPSQQADVLVIWAQAESANAAVAIAKQYVDTYIELRSAAAIEDFEATREVIQAQYAEVQQQLAGLPAGDSAERQVLESQLTAYGDALGDLSVSINRRAGRAEVIREPRNPGGPFAPSTTRNVMLGLIVGLVGGAGLALLIESFDQSIAGKDEIEAATPGAPNLAMIPALTDWREREATRIESSERPNSQASEAYRVLRSGIEFAAVDNPIEILQVTSSNPGEGKTTTVANLALAMARTGKQVVLLDADLRKPRAHSFFDVPIEPGFTDVILGNAAPRDVLHVVENNGGVLAVIPSGALPPGPSELLGSERARTVLEQIAEQSDLIVIDSPPVLPVSDALVIARHVDATLLVANATETSLPDLEEAYERLIKADARVVGTVLNETRTRRHGYGYGYGYTSDG